jgi:hypothetical protein
LHPVPGGWLQIAASRAPIPSDGGPPRPRAVGISAAVTAGMPDVAFVLVTIAFFALGWAYARGTERL